MQLTCEKMKVFFFCWRVCSNILHTDALTAHRRFEYVNQLVILLSECNCAMSIASVAKDQYFRPRSTPRVFPKSRVLRPSQAGPDQRYVGFDAQDLWPKSTMNDVKPSEVAREPETSRSPSQSAFQVHTWGHSGRFANKYSLSVSRENVSRVKTESGVATAVALASPTKLLTRVRPVLYMRNPRR